MLHWGGGLAGQNVTFFFFFFFEGVPKNTL